PSPHPALARRAGHFVRMPRRPRLAPLLPYTPLFRSPPVPVRPSRQVVVYSAREETATARTIVGQTLWPARDGVGEGGAMPGPGGTLLPALDSRGIAGQSMFPAAEDLTPLVASPSVPSRGAEHRLQREPAAPALITPGRFAGKVVLV